MKKVVVNIGLNIGAEEPQQQLSRTLISLLGYYALTSVRVEEVGVYKGSEERTLVAYFQTSSEETLVSVLSYFCRDLYQEAIAYKCEGVGDIAFNPSYTGEQFPFDQQFFID
jgi:hypothetical protein